MSIMTDNSNISIVDIGVRVNEPMDAPEPWTMAMYICLFIGGFWCGAMTFLMILIVNMYKEQRRAGQYQGAVIATMPFWVEWRSSMASQLTRGERLESSDEDTGSSGTSAGVSLYEDIAIRTSDLEHAEVRDRDSDAQAIHYWRPFEEGPTMKTFGRNLNGECCKIYLKDPAGSRLRVTGGSSHDALHETMQGRWRWGARDSRGAI